MAKKKKLTKIEELKRTIDRERKWSNVLGEYLDETMDEKWEYEEMLDFILGNFKTRDLLKFYRAIKEEHYKDLRSAEKLYSECGCCK